MYVCKVWLDEWLMCLYVRIHRYIHSIVCTSDCICNNMNGNVLLYVILKD